MIWVPVHSYSPLPSPGTPRSRAPALPKAQKPGKTNPPSVKAKACPKAKVSPKVASKAKAKAKAVARKNGED